MITLVTLSSAPSAPLNRKAFVHHSLVRSAVPNGTGTSCFLPSSGRKLGGRMSSTLDGGTHLCSGFGVNPMDSASTNGGGGTGCGGGGPTRHETGPTGVRPTLS